MGINTKPVQRWEVLPITCITIRSEGQGVLVEMTVDGAASLVHNLRRVKSGKPDTYLVDYFLEDLIRIGKKARRKLLRPYLNQGLNVCGVPFYSPRLTVVLVREVNLMSSTVKLRIEPIAEEAREVHLLFNTNNEDQGPGQGENVSKTVTMRVLSRPTQPTVTSAHCAP